MIIVLHLYSAGDEECIINSSNAHKQRLQEMYGNNCDQCVEDALKDETNSIYTIQDDKVI